MMDNSFAALPQALFNPLPLPSASADIDVPFKFRRASTMPVTSLTDLLSRPEDHRTLVNDQGRRRCLRTDSRRRSTGSVPKKVRFQVTGPSSVMPEESKVNRHANRKQGLFMSFFSSCQSCQSSHAEEPHKRGRVVVAAA